MLPANEWKTLARELTGWDLMRRIKNGHDIALLPVGSMEMHGPQSPLGTDTYIAEAVCRMAAIEMKGTVFDTISYTWSGMTKYSFPTVSMSMNMETNYTRMVCDELARIGLKRIYVVQFHGPGIALMRLAREFFEEKGVPLAFYGLLRLLNMSQSQYRKCKNSGIAWEASVCAAAVKFLGYDATIDPTAWDEGVPVKPLPGQNARKQIAETGGLVGTLGTDDSHHEIIRGQVDLNIGMEILQDLAKNIASSADAMADLRDAWENVDLPTSWPSMITG